MNIGEFVESAVMKNPDKIYLYFRDQEISYKDFNHLTNKVAHQFQNIGIQKGDAVALMLPMCPQFLYSWIALNKIGAIEVPLNPAFKEREAYYVLENSEAKAIVVHSDCLGVINNIKKDLPAMKQVIVVGDGMNSGGILFAEWLRHTNEETRPISIPDDHPAAFIYSSGTTGFPKGVILSHRSWVLAGQSWAYMIGVRPDDRIMTPNPLFHINSQCYAVMSTLAAGASLILMERFSASQLWDQTRHYGATVLLLTATVLPWIWSQPPKEDDASNPVRVLEAGGFSGGNYYDFEKRFGLKLHTLYSLSEAPLCVMAPRDPRLRKPTPAVGIPAEHPDPSIKNEVKVVNEAGEELGANQPGEIIVRNPAVMIGYYKDPERTVEAKRNGWIYTGDIGYLDESKYLYFVGRKKEVLRRRGELIDPVEIEMVINQHPKIESSAVVGVPSGFAVAEEEIKAYLQLKTGENCPPQEIWEWCLNSLAPFKVPRYLEFIDEIPRTATWKIQKNLLKAAKKDLSEGCFDQQKHYRKSSL